MRRSGGRIRIIGGNWRGSRLAVPVVDGLRPTPDRVRETLFNWLQPDVTGADCLDLFAGSGALGFEAASRGARHVTLVERDAAQARLLAQQADTLGAENIDTVAAEALAWLRQSTARFDIIFIDPPYDSDLAAAALTIIASRAMLRTGGLVYVELGKQQTPPAGWRLHKQTRAGQVQACLLKEPVQPQAAAE